MFMDQLRNNASRKYEIYVTCDICLATARPVCHYQPVTDQPVRHYYPVTHETLNRDHAITDRNPAGRGFSCHEIPGSLAPWRPASNQSRNHQQLGAGLIISHAVADNPASSCTIRAVHRAQLPELQRIEEIAE